MTTRAVPELTQATASPSSRLIASKRDRRILTGRAGWRCVGPARRPRSDDFQNALDRSPYALLDRGSSLAVTEVHAP